MFVHRSRVLQISLVAILSAFAVEMYFGLISGSLALITDSIHALLDAVVTAILLIAARMAVKPPDADHTYGHGKIESLGGLIGGIAIFLIACLFIYESVSRIQGPPPPVLPGLFAVAGGLYTIGIDIFRIVLLRRATKKLGGETLKADFYHAFMDLGSTMVAIAGIVLVSYGFHNGDFAAALVLGGLLAALSVKLVYRTSMDLTDVISPELVGRVRRIAASTAGVIGAGPVLMRRSGDTVFADVTVSLRGDTSFEKAHRISGDVEGNIRGEVPNASVTVHFEPSWTGVPLDARVADAAAGVAGVRGVHNVSTHRAGGRSYSDLHVMVDREINLASAHGISEEVEQEIHRMVPEIEHATIHLEPFITVPENPDIRDAAAEERIRGILTGYPRVAGVGRIVTLVFGNILKIDIDCSFDGRLSIEEVHDMTSAIEYRIRGEINNAVITIHPEPG